jgi:beta-lactamase class A
MVPRAALRSGLALAGLALAWCSLSRGAGAGGDEPAGLAARVREIAARSTGRVWLFARNLDTGASFGLLADEPVRSASTIKLAIMVEAFARVAAGEARWDEPLRLRAESKVEGAGVLFELDPGLTLTLRDALRLMLVVSDNTATNLVVDRLGADAVNARMDALGLPHTRLMRKIGGGGDSAAGKDPANRRFGLGSTTCREMVTLLGRIEAGEVVSREASAEMIAILKREQFPDGIGRRRSGCATKAGALDRLRSDVGIVYTPAGRVALAITVDEIKDVEWTVDNPGLLAIASLTDVLVDALAPPRPSRP